MTINEQIFIIANQLTNQGKKPTVALVKTQLNQAAPLPIIIKALKNWQYDPEFTKLKTNNKTNAINNTVETKTTDQKIMEALVPLQQELVELKAEIALLKQQINTK